MSQVHADIAAFRAALLDSIRRHDGKATWYQLDRAVVVQFPHLSEQLIPVLRSMEAAEEIESLPNPHVEGMPYYRCRR